MISDRPSLWLGSGTQWGEIWRDFKGFGLRLEIISKGKKGWAKNNYLRNWIWLTSLGKPKKD